MTEGGAANARAATWAHRGPRDGARPRPRPRGDSLGGPHGEKDRVRRDGLHEDRPSETPSPTQATVQLATASGARILPRPRGTGSEEAGA
eukprot:6507889-Alexandrium_andersonii.AAC.1